MRLVYKPNHPHANENGMIELTESRSNDPHFYVISDTMESTRHMADGRYYTSKRKFRDATKAAGCVEIGNEAPKTRTRIPLSREKRREDIKRTIYEIRNGRKSQ
jgi:hypothetical protein